MINFLEVQIKQETEIGLPQGRQPIAVSDISIYICLIDILDGSSKPVYMGGLFVCRVSAQPKLAADHVSL